MEWNHLTRRGFLQLSSSGLLAAGVLPGAALASSAGSAKNVIACRDTHLQDFGAPDSWSAMKRIGVTGVEVLVDPDRTCRSLFHPDKKYSIGSPRGIAALGNDLEESGLVITAFCTANHFDERLEDELALMNDVLEACKKLNVNAVRIDVVQRKIKKPEEFLNFSISVGKRLTEPLRGTGVRYGIENHGTTTNNPAFLDRLFDAVKSDALGLTLDTANFYWYGHPLDDLYGIYEKYAPRTWHTHCKSINYPEDQRNVRRKMGWEYGKYCSPIHQGDIDFERVISILHAADYKGDLCIENESLGRFPEEEREKILQEEAALLSRLA